MLDCPTCIIIDDDLFEIAEMITYYESADVYHALSRVRDELNIQWDVHQEYDHANVSSPG